MAALTPSSIFTITLTGTSLAELAKEAEKFLTDFNSTQVSTVNIVKLDTVQVSAKVINDSDPKVSVATIEPKKESLPTCIHGNRTHRSGTSKAGKPYDGYYCPEKTISEQCSPIFPSQLKKNIPADKVNQYNENENF